MAIVVLVLWLFTAGAGFSLLVTSNLGRSRPAPSTATATASAAAEVPAGTPVKVAASTSAAAEVAGASAVIPVAPAAAATSAAATSAAATSAAAASNAPAAAPASKRELKRAARERFDPPSLTAARHAPMMPGLRPLLEFAHPAFAVIGLGFWLGFTLVHNRVLGWIAFGLVTATVCLGLTWFTANARAAKRRDRGEPPPSFGIRLVVLHGGAAAVTFVLAALSALVLSR